MKAYLYDTETGIYEGETYEEPDMLQYEEGITSVPPPDYGHGQVAVFDRVQQIWAVVPTTIARQLLKLSQDESREQAP